MVEDLSHLSQVLLYLSGQPILRYIHFLYGRVVFTSAFHSEKLGGVDLIHCRAINFLSEKSDSWRNSLVYLSRSKSGKMPSRHCLGSRDRGDPISSWRKSTICFHRPWSMGHCQSRWKNVPVSCVHIEQAVVVSGLKRATLGSPLFYLGIMHCKWLPITLLLRSRATAGRAKILLTSVGKSHGRSAPPAVALDQSGSESHDRSEYSWNKLFRVFIFFFLQNHTDNVFLPYAAATCCQSSVQRDSVGVIPNSHISLHGSALIQRLYF